MARILTKLRIDEVSAVDRGAGDGVKIVLMKRDDTPRSKPHVERHARRLRKFQEIFARDEDDAADRDDDTFEKIFTGKAGGADIAKARDRHDVGGRGLAAATSELALDLIHHHRRRLGLVAKGGGQLEESSMRISETLENIMKDGSIAGVCAAIVAKGVTTLSQDEIVEAVGKIAVERYVGLSEAQAFAKIYSDGGAEGRVLRQAINVAKASLAETMLGPGLPVQGSQHAKADHGSAYNELMEKAEQYRDAHPECSISQAFEKVFTAPAHRELAKRERFESAPR